MKIAIFASGTGTNAARIIQHFSSHPLISVSLVASNRPGAGVLGISKTAGIPTLVIEKERFFSGDGYVQELTGAGITHIILAGFLWKIPLSILQAFPERILNIHPALLPKYGGKGMYGNYVHEAVIENKDPESGISIHLVDEVYDNGKIIFQAKTPVTFRDTPSSLAEKIHALEHLHFPVEIEKWMMAH